MPLNKNRNRNNRRGKGSSGGGSKPFQPLAPAFNTQKQYKRAIKRRVKGALQDQLQPIKKQEKTETLANDKREQDLRNYYNYYGNELEEASGSLSSSLDNLIATSGGADASAQALMKAALEGGRSADLAQATTAGGVAADQSPSMLALGTGAASGSAGQGALAGMFGGLNYASEGRRGVAALDRTRALEDEESRNRARMMELADERLAVLKQKPALKEEARSSIMESERAAAMQRLQRKVANEELDLSGKQLKEQKRQFDAQLQFDAAELQQQQKQFDDELALAVQEGKLSQSDADKGVSRFRVARTQLENWLSAQSEGKKGGQLSDSEVAQLFRMLTGNYNIPKDMAYQVLRGSGNQKLRAWANSKSGRRVKNDKEGISNMIDMVTGWFS